MYNRNYNHLQILRSFLHPEHQLNISIDIWAIFKIDVAHEAISLTFNTHQNINQLLDLYRANLQLCS